MKRLHKPKRNNIPELFQGYITSHVAYFVTFFDIVVSIHSLCSQKLRVLDSLCEDGPCMETHVMYRVCMTIQEAFSRAYSALIVIIHTSHRNRF